MRGAHRICRRLAFLLGILVAGAVEPRDGALRAAICDAEASVHLLQTAALHHATASSGIAAGSMLDAEAVATAKAAAAEEAAAAGASAITGHLNRVASSVTTGKTGKAVFFILPILGFILTLVAIFVTVIFERGLPVASDGKAPIDGRLPATGIFASRGGASGVLQGRDAKDAVDAHYGYRRPQLNLKAKLEPQDTAARVSHGYGMGTALDVAGVPPARPDASEAGLQVRLPRLRPNQAIGLNMSEASLEIMSFCDPIASTYGLQVGDRVVQVNGIPVREQDDFVRQLAVARHRDEVSGEPVVLTVLRGDPSPTVAPRAVPSILAPADPSSWVGTWQYEDADHPSGHRYIITQGIDGALMFEQELPDGQQVRGILNRTTAEEVVRESQLHLMGSGERFGYVRFRLLEEGVLQSNLRPEGEASFGQDVYATRSDAKPKKAKRKKGRLWVC